MNRSGPVGFRLCPRLPRALAAHASTKSISMPCFRGALAMPCLLPSSVPATQHVYAHPGLQRTRAPRHTTSRPAPRMRRRGRRLFESRRWLSACIIGGGVSPSKCALFRLLPRCVARLMLEAAQCPFAFLGSCSRFFFSSRLAAEDALAVQVRPLRLLIRWVAGLMLEAAQRPCLFRNSRGRSGLFQPRLSMALCSSLTPTSRACAP